MALILPVGTVDLWHLAQIEDSVAGWCEVAEELSSAWAHFECANPGHHEDVVVLANLALERARMLVEESENITLQQEAA